MNCPNCQHLNSITAKFCEECGIKLGISSSQSFIPPEAKKATKTAERRQLTVLFCDLVGSTALSERLDAEDFRQVILSYQEVAEKVVKQYGGHIAQYLGDGLLVYFGYPIGLEDAPKASIHAGLGIIKAVHLANQEWAAAGRTQIDIRIGINSGLVVVDDFLALGDTVNIAARLEGLAPKNALVISSHTQALAKNWFEFNTLGYQKLKGIQEPLEVFQVLGAKGQTNRIEIAKKIGLSPLLGRDIEVKLLRSSWEATKLGKGQVILLNGEAGIGKSRLVEVVKSWAKEEKEIKLSLYCSAYHLNTPFYPLIDLLENRILLFEPTENAQSKVQKLENWLEKSRLPKKEYLSVFADFLGIPPSALGQALYHPLPLTPAGKKKRFIEGFLGSLFNYAEHRTVLLIIEDIHWMDASTIEWTQLLINQLENKTILTLISTRPVEEGGPKLKFSKAGSQVQINLKKLTGPAIEAICLYQAKQKLLPKEVINQIQEKTDGIPFFVEELTRMVLQSDFLVEKEKHFELVPLADASIPTIAIPATLQGSLSARLDKLGTAKEIAQIGSIVGREFSHALLKKISGQAEESLQENLQALINAEILTPKSSPLGTSYYFKHALIQDAAYNSVLKVKKKKLHRATAYALGDFSPISKDLQPAQIAHHLTEAESYKEALYHWLLAGQNAINAYANKEANHHLRKGISIIDKLPDSPEIKGIQTQLLVALASSVINIYGYSRPEIEKLNLQAVELCKAINSPHLFFVLQRLELYYRLSGQLSKAIEWSKQCMEVAKATKNPSFLMVSQTYFAHSKKLIGDYPIAAKHFEIALKYQAESDPKTLAFLGQGSYYYHVKAIYGSVLCQTKPDLAIKNLNDLYDRAKKSGHPVEIYMVGFYTCIVHIIRKEYKQIPRVLSYFRELAHKNGDVGWIIPAELFHTFYLIYEGDLTKIPNFMEIMAKSQKLGSPTYGLFMSTLLVIAFVKNKMYEQALVAIQQIIALTNFLEETFFLPEIHRLHGVILKNLQKPEAEIEAAFLKAYDTAKAQNANWFQLMAAKNLAQFWQEQEKTIEAFDVLKNIYEQFTEGYDTIEMKEAKELLKELDISSTK